MNGSDKLWYQSTEAMKSFLKILLIILLIPVMLVVLRIGAGLIVEPRQVTSPTMTPTLQAGDCVLVEKVSTYLKKPFTRGEIIIFYYPPVMVDGKDLNPDIQYILGRMTLLPFLPYENVLIKRVIGVPGDIIRIIRGKGVILNGKFLNDASYVQQRPTYDLNVLGDIGGRDLNGKVIRPYIDDTGKNKPIVVPKDQLFVLGDNCEYSADSHNFGFIRMDRVVGRAVVRCCPSPKIIELPKY